MDLYIYNEKIQPLGICDTFISLIWIILNTNKIQEKICAEILYMRDYRLDFFQILNGV